MTKSLGRIPPTMPKWCTVTKTLQNIWKCDQRYRNLNLVYRIWIFHAAGCRAVTEFRAQCPPMNFSSNIAEIGCTTTTEMRVDFLYLSRKMWICQLVLLCESKKILVATKKILVGGQGQVYSKMSFFALPVAKAGLTIISGPKAIKSFLKVQLKCHAC